VKVEVIKSTKHDNGCFIGVPADWNWTNVDTLLQATRSHINISFIMYLTLFNKMNCSWTLIGSYFDKFKFLPRSSTLLFVLFIKKIDSLLPFTCLCATMIKFYPSLQFLGVSFTRDQKQSLPLVPEIFRFEKCVKYANQSADDVIHSTKYCS